MKKFIRKFSTAVLIIVVAIFPILVIQNQTYASPVEDSEEDVSEEAVQPEVPVNDNPDWPTGPGVEAMSAVVMDYDTGTVLYNKAGTDMHYPASITKIMTALVALENSELDEIVTFSQYAVYSIEAGSSSISRDIGEEMTMEQCLYGLMLESANECANAIAEHIAGSVEAFVDMMNQKAADLGCVNTHFVNPHGLHDSNHYTCASDMAIIARAAYANPTFALITGTKGYTIPPTNKHEDPTPLNNHHAMLNYYRTNKYIYDNCLGGKTGYTSDALGTLVTYAKAGDITLITVVMCVSGSGNYTDTRSLFDFFFSNIQTIPISMLDNDYSQLMGSRISEMMGDDEIPFELDETATLMLPNGADISKITAEFVPAEANNHDSLGEIRYSYSDRVVGSAEISAKNIDFYPFMNVTPQEDGSPQKVVAINLISLTIVIVVVIAIVLFIIYSILRTNNAFFTIRRKRLENRDPHKNYRRIKRARMKRGRRR